MSTDKVSWQFEGEVMGQEGVNLYYATLAGDKLIYMRLDAGTGFFLASATVQMP